MVKLKLYKIWQTEHNDYDTYEEAKKGLKKGIIIDSFNAG